MSEVLFRRSNFAHKLILKTYLSRMYLAFFQQFRLLHFQKQTHKLLQIFETLPPSGPLWGGPTFGKNSQTIPFFWGWRPRVLIDIDIFKNVLFDINIDIFKNYLFYIDNNIFKSGQYIKNNIFKKCHSRLETLRVVVVYRKSDLNEGNLLEGVSSVSSLLARFETIVTVILTTFYNFQNFNN